MSTITFEQLPQAVGKLTEELAEIKALLKAQGNTGQAQQTDALLTVEEAATFLSLSKPTIYSLISKGELPVMKRGKRCYFSKEELFAYIKQGRQKTNAELGVKALEHIKTGKR